MSATKALQIAAVAAWATLTCVAIMASTTSTWRYALVGLILFFAFMVCAVIADDAS